MYQKVQKAHINQKNLLEVDGTLPFTLQLLHLPFLMALYCMYPVACTLSIVARGCCVTHNVMAKPHSPPNPDAIGSIDIDIDLQSLQPLRLLGAIRLS